MKKCKLCGIEKEISEFHKHSEYRGKYYYRSSCIKCTKENNKEWTKKYRCSDRYKNYHKEYRSRPEVKERVFLAGKIYRQTEKGKNTAKRWSIKNSETLKFKNNEYTLKKLHTDIPFRLAYLLRRRLKTAIRRGYKSGSAVKDLGCSIEELKKRFEKMFQPGMNWDNQGKWHIDHIKPLALFDLTDREQFLKAVHYTNLQPLWAKDNLKKGCKYNENKK